MLLKHNNDLNIAVLYCEFRQLKDLARNFTQNADRRDTSAQLACYGIGE